MQSTIAHLKAIVAIIIIMTMAATGGHQRSIVLMASSSENPLVFHLNECFKVFVKMK